MQLTLVHATRPNILTKHFDRGPDGTLTKRTSGHLTEGRATRETVMDMPAFADLVSGLRPSEALLYGTLPEGMDMARVVTRDTYAATPEASRAGLVSRTKEHLSYSVGAGIMMTDWDRGLDGSLLPIEEALTLLRRTLPEASTAPMMMIPSASSHITDVATGQDLTGLSGYRIYIAVDDASRIPDVASILHARLLAAGHGHAAISKSGAVRIKSLIDMAVYTAPHLDFAAGASCGSGLKQQRGVPRVIDADGAALATAAVVLSDRDAADAAAAEAALRAEAAPEAARIARAWRAERLESLATKGVDPATAARIVERAERGELVGDFVLQVVDTDTRTVDLVTVAKVLADPERFDGCLTLDPIEPDYDNSRPVGKLLLGNRRRPRLKSFARGGTVYSLLPAAGAVAPDLAEILIREGGTAQAVDQTLAALATTGMHYRSGTAIVEIVKRTALMLSADTCAYRLGCLFDYRREARVGGEIQIQRTDPTPGLVRQLLAHPAPELPELAAYVDRPTARPDGTLITQAGHDMATRLYVSRGIEAFPTYSADPTPPQLSGAIDTCLAPFQAYDLMPGSLAAILAAVLTAVVRPALATSPIILVREADIGAGKTLLTEALGAIAEGETPSPQVMPEGRAELRKRLLSLLLAGTSTILLDNADGMLRSDVLAAFATAATWSDRELGRSSMRTELPNRALLLVNGRNVRGADGLARRILPIEIAPAGRDRIGRSYDFSPVDRAVETRDAIIGAALTLIGAVPDGFAPAGSIGSFREWDRVVRRTVAWIATWDGRFTDPRDLVMAELASDGEQDGRRGLLEFLQDLIEGDLPPEFTAAEVVACARLTDRTAELEEHLNSVSASRSTMSSKSVGSILALLRDADVHGLCLRGYRRKGRTVWSVEDAEAARHLRCA